MAYGQEVLMHHLRPRFSRLSSDTLPASPGMSKTIRPHSRSGAKAEEGVIGQM